MSNQGPGDKPVGHADPAPARLLNYHHRTPTGDLVGGNWMVPRGDFRAFLGYKRPTRKEKAGRVPVSGSRVIEIALYEAFEEIGEGAAKHGQPARNQWISHAPYTDWPGREKDLFEDIRDAVLQSEEQRSDQIDPERYLRAGTNQYWQLLMEFHERSKEDNKKFLFVQYKWGWQNMSFDTISDIQKARHDAIMRALERS